MNKWFWVILFAPGCIIVEDDDKTTETGGTTDDTPTDTGTPPDPLDIDDDGDGVSENDGDCNDVDSLINPSALEICDTVDNNCNGGIDDEAAVTLNGANHPSVDAALAAAVAGDALVVCPGDWEVTSFVAAGDLTLQSISGSSVTSLHEVAGATIFTVSGSLTLDGFTMTGSVGPALEVVDSGVLSVKNSTITGNGQGILMDCQPPDSGTLSVETSSIDTNDAGNGDGGGISATGSFGISLTGSTLSANNAANGGALFARVIFGIGSVSLTETAITGNTADIGGGIVLQNVPLTGDALSEISGNTASTAGGGAALYRASMSSVLVSTNDAPAGGGVAALQDNDFAGAPLANPLLAVVVDSNTADLGAGIWVDNEEPASVDGYSSVTLNTAGTSGGGAYLDGADSTFESLGANFGDPKVSNDNTPEDVFAGGQSFNYLPGEAFSCTGGGGCTVP